MPKPPPPKLTPKIILEGTRLTHKTDIAFALNDHPRVVGPRKYQYHSPLISAEWSSFNNVPWGRVPINFEAQEEAQAMEVYETWARMFELQRYYSWIVDRFHISTQVVQAHNGRHYDFRWLEERLLPLGFCIVLCVRREETFPAAREERLKVSGSPRQYDNLDVFIQEQRDFQDAISRSILPHMEIDTSDANSDDDINVLCDRIADWLQANDLLGLYD